MPVVGFPFFECSLCFAVLVVGAAQAPVRRVKINSTDGWRTRSPRKTHGPPNIDAGTATCWRVGGDRAEGGPATVLRLTCRSSPRLVPCDIPPSPKK